MFLTYCGKVAALERKRKADERTNGGIDPRRDNLHHEMDVLDVRFNSIFGNR